jgi:hypothetical protein
MSELGCLDAFNVGGSLCSNLIHSSHNLEHSLKPLFKKVASETACIHPCVGSERPGAALAVGGGWGGSTYCWHQDLVIDLRVASPPSSSARLCLALGPPLDARGPPSRSAIQCSDRKIIYDTYRAY